MKKTFKFLTAGLALSATLLAMTGCGNKKESNADKKSDKTLSMMYSVDNQQQKTALNWLVDTYKEEKGIQVDLTEMPSSDMKTKLKNAVISGDAPDLVKITGPDQSYVKNLVDLKDIFDEFDFKENYAFKYGDEVISTPIGLTTVGMFINKDLWDKAGVSYPKTPEEVWTWEDFSKKAREVQEKSGAKYGLVMDKSEHRLKNYLFQWGLSFYDETGKGTLYGSDHAKKAYEFFKEMNDDALMPKSVYLSGEDAASMFKTGQVAAYYSGSWQVQDFEKNITNFEVAACYMPYETKRAANPGGDYIAAFKDTGKEKEATDFMKWMYSDEIYTQLCEKYGYLPALNDIEPKYEVANDEYQVFLNELDSSSPLPLNDKSYNRDMKASGAVSTDGLIMDRISKYLNDEITVDEAAKEIGDEIHEAVGLEVIK